MKTCIKCKQTKPRSEFHKDAVRKDALAGACKRCANRRVREYSVDNQDKIKVKDTKRRQDHQTRMTKLKQTSGCTKCGSLEDLLYHHVDPHYKEFGIGNGYKYTEERLQAELEKCVVVCSPCHTTLHNLRTVRPNT